MSPPQVSGLVAMVMPQQKEACVWGPVPGRREEDKGRGEKGLYLHHTLWTSVWLDKKEEERKSSQRHKTGLDCLLASCQALSLYSRRHLNIKLLMGG